MLSLINNSFLYTDPYMKEYKLYDKLLNKINLETKLSVFEPSGKDRPALIPIPQISIPSIHNNPLTYFPSPSLFYKSLLSSLESK